MSDAQDTDSARTLLVIDDEADILDAIKRLFRRRYHVLTAQSIEQAVELVNSEDIQVVLADQRLPRRTGIEFFAELRHTHPDIVRVLFTGYTNIDDVIDAINEGHIYRYISKPWKPHELRPCIDQAFEYYESAREREMLLEKLREANAKLEEQNEMLSRANEQLATLDRVRKVFMEVVSHELNTPITIMMGYLWLLRGEVGEHSQKADNFLNLISASSNRLRRISERIHEVIHHDHPANTLKLQEIDLMRFAMGLEEQVAPFLVERHQKLVCNIDSGLESIQGDEEKLADLFYQLIINAIKFSHDHKTIFFTAKRHLEREDHVQFTVQDHGVGIPEEEQAQIFELFFSSFQTRNHSSGVYQFNKRGIGMGLAIVKRFAFMHGGEVEVTSTEGEGTTFTVSLPATQSLE
ncbi:MAG: hybrid sensor histidine kinase/response regulator [Myxococcota bacterium]